MQSHYSSLSAQQAHLMPLLLFLKLERNSLFFSSNEIFLIQSLPNSTASASVLSPPKNLMHVSYDASSINSFLQSNSLNYGCKQKNKKTTIIFEKFKRIITLVFLTKIY